MYVFFGNDDIKNQKVNTIEVLDTHKKEGWKLLTINDSQSAIGIVRHSIFSLQSNDSTILIFGGSNDNADAYLYGPE